MGRRRATAAAATRATGAVASRSRRANPESKPTFFSPRAAATAATRKRNGGASSSSSPSPSPSSRTDVSFVSPPFSASPEPARKSRSSKPRAKAKPAARSPPLASPLSPAAPAAASASVVSSVEDLRSAAASQMESLRCRLDGIHSRGHIDLDGSLSRASKRFKTQNQACQQLTYEVDKEYRKMSDSMKETAEKIKAKYKLIMAETRSSTSHVSKVTIPEITKSVEKAIDRLCSRYNISMPV
ncbi:unnamed protein product [Alopecurus aequalis]